MSFPGDLLHQGRQLGRDSTSSLQPPELPDHTTSPKATYSSLKRKTMWLAFSLAAVVCGAFLWGSGRSILRAALLACGSIIWLKLMHLLGLATDPMRNLASRVLGLPRRNGKGNRVSHLPKQQQPPEPQGSRPTPSRVLSLPVAPPTPSRESPVAADPGLPGTSTSDSAFATLTSPSFAVKDTDQGQGQCVYPEPPAGASPQSSNADPARAEGPTHGSYGSQLQQPAASTSATNLPQEISESDIMSFVAEPSGPLLPQSQEAALRERDGCNVVPPLGRDLAADWDATMYQITEEPEEDLLDYTVSSSNDSTGRRCARAAKSPGGHAVAAEDPPTGIATTYSTAPACAGWREERRQRRERQQQQQRPSHAEPCEGSGQAAAPSGSSAQAAAVGSTSTSGLNAHPTVPQPAALPEGSGSGTSQPQLDAGAATGGREQQRLCGRAATMGALVGPSSRRASAGGRAAPSLDLGTLLRAFTAEGSPSPSAGCSSEDDIAEPENTPGDGGGRGGKSGGGGGLLPSVRRQSGLGLQRGSAGGTGGDGGDGGSSRRPGVTVNRMDSTLSPWSAIDPAAANAFTNALTAPQQHQLQLPAAAAGAGGVEPLPTPAPVAVYPSASAAAAAAAATAGGGALLPSVGSESAVPSDSLNRGSMPVANAYRHARTCLPGAGSSRSCLYRSPRRHTALSLKLQEPQVRYWSYCRQASTG